MKNKEGLGSDDSVYVRPDSEGIVTIPASVHKLYAEREAKRLKSHKEVHGRRVKEQLFDWSLHRNG